MASTNTSQIRLDAGPLEQLNAEQKALLDTVDSLRDLGVDKYVEIPQIIVVGDQSSGKSSVLQAISRVRFPTRGGLCTRFATELILRSAPRVKISVSVSPSSDDSSTSDNSSTSDTNQSQNLPFNETAFSRDALPEIIERAKIHMGIREDSPSSFSKDILRVQIWGPELQSLTLVDLPGFFQSETSEQSAAGISIVDDLVERYMRQSKSIILAVVSARSSFAVQKVIAQAKRCDPLRERTLGIITKPDLLLSGSDDERRYVQVGQNEEPANILKLGWHVLRNRGENEANISDDARDTKEAELFRSGVWSRLYAKDKGVDQLRKKLSKVLVNHIKRSLDDLISDIERHLTLKSETLARLGNPRSNPADLRTYLHDIASAFQELTQDAVRGDYNDKFFGGLYREADLATVVDIRKLRATLRNLNRAFDAVLAIKGASRKIQWPGDEDASVADEDFPEFLQPFIELYDDVKDPTPVAIEDLLDELERLASDNQGVEFPGWPNGDLARMLFRRQAEPWRGIAQNHIDLVLDVTKSFVEAVMQHIVGSDSKTRNAVLVHFVDPFFDAKRTVLKDKLDELLRPYNSKYALPLESHFRSKLSSMAVDQLATRVKETLRREHPEAFTQSSGSRVTDLVIREAILDEPESDISEFGTEKVVDIMTTYYEVCFKVPPLLGYGRGNKTPVLTYVARCL